MLIVIKEKSMKISFVSPQNHSDETIKKELLKIGVKSFMNEAGFIPEKVIDGMDFIWQIWDTRLEEQVPDLGEWIPVYGMYDPFYDGNEVIGVKLLVIYTDSLICAVCHHKLQRYFDSVSPTLRFTSHGITRDVACVGCGKTVYGIPF